MSDGVLARRWRDRPPEARCKWEVDGAGLDTTAPGDFNPVDDNDVPGRGDVAWNFDVELRALLHVPDSNVSGCRPGLRHCWSGKLEVKVEKVVQRASVRERCVVVNLSR